MRFATGAKVEIIVYCPAAHMQLKEVQTHVRWPSESTVRPLSDHASTVPRLADLERSYRDLWKFYVFADASEPRLLRRADEVALVEQRHDAPRIATHARRVVGLRDDA